MFAPITAHRGMDRQKKLTRPYEGYEFQKFENRIRLLGNFSLFKEKINYLIMGCTYKFPQITVPKQIHKHLPVFE